VIKNLGDEVLFVADDPAAAAEATLQLFETIAGEEALPRVHAGLACTRALPLVTYSAPW